MGDLGVRVGDQGESERSDLVSERLLRLQRVGRAAGDAQAKLFEPLEPCLELEGLVRSAGRIGLEVEEEDEGASFDGVREAEATAGGISFEVWSARPLRDHVLLEGLAAGAG